MLRPLARILRTGDGRARLFVLALCLSASACELSACDDGGDPQPTIPAPDTLLNRVLDRAAAAPSVAARVAAGALAKTSTAATPRVARRAAEWASAAGDPAALEAVASALARRGRTEDLERWLAEADPSQLERIRAAFITTRAELGDVSFASGGLASLSDPERADRARMAVVRALLRRGHIDAAIEALEPLHDRRLRDEALSELARVHALARRRRDALATLAAIESPFHRAKGEAALARVDYARGRRKRAIDRAKLIESKLVRAELFADLARQADRAGRRREATRLFRRARAVAERIDDRFLRDNALSQIAVELASAGRSEAADQVRAELSAESAAEVTAKRIHELARRGALGEARALASALDAPGLVASEAEAAVARLEAKRGEIDAALERTARIAIPALRWRTLGEIAASAEDAPVGPARLETLERALRQL